MTLLNDRQIIALAEQGMITPFEPRLIRSVPVPGMEWGNDKCLLRIMNPVLSYGPSSYGYDLRLSPKDFRVFRHVPGTVTDPKQFNSRCLESVELHNDSYFILPAHSYGLGVAVERLSIPADVTVVFIGKSTYARCGIIVNTTPAEAGWQGHLTLEFSNSSDADCRIYANEGVCQGLFYKGDPCDVSYQDRSGKYQGQPESVTLPIV